MIEYASELDVRFATNPNKGRRWMLLAPFVFYVDGEKFEVPIFFWTDFASIPKIVWPIVSPYDIGKGPIPHDFGYFSGLKTKEFWDDVLIECMRYEKIERWKCRPVYNAVHWLGKATWDYYRKQGTTIEQINKLEMR
jgi:hypothetical protein